MDCSTYIWEKEIDMLEKFTASAKKLPEGLQVETTSRNFTFLFDEPVELGGTDKSMNPVEGLLCALSACQTIVAYAFCDSQGIKLQEFSVELEGDLDPDGFMGKADVRNGFQEIRYTMHFKADNSKEELERFAKFIEDHCPVGDSIQNGVPMKLAGVVID